MRHRLAAGCTNWWFRVLPLRRASALVAIDERMRGQCWCPLTLLEDWLRPGRRTRRRTASCSAGRHRGCRSTTGRGGCSPRMLPRLCGGRLGAHLRSCIRRQLVSVVGWLNRGRRDGPGLRTTRSRSPGTGASRSARRSPWRGCCGRRSRRSRTDARPARACGSASSARNAARSSCGRLEAAIGAQVVLVQAIQRPGDVAGDGVDRLGFAAIALGRARIDDHHAGRIQVRQHVVHVDRDVARPAGERRRLDGGTVGGDRRAGLDPRLPARRPARRRRRGPASAASTTGGWRRRHRRGRRRSPACCHPRRWRRARP